MNIDLNELERLATVATPGPWSVNTKTGNIFHEENPDFAIANVGRVFGSTSPNLRFIAAAHPETVLALIARIRELESRQTIEDHICTGELLF